MAEFIIDRLYKVWNRAVVNANSPKEAKEIYDKHEETGDRDENILHEDLVTDSIDDMMPGIFEQESDDGTWWSYNPIADRFYDETYIIMQPESARHLMSVKGFRNNAYPFMPDAKGIDKFGEGCYLVSLAWLEKHADDIKWEYV